MSWVCISKRLPWGRIGLWFVGLLPSRLVTRLALWEIQNLEKTASRMGGGEGTEIVMGTVRMGKSDEQLAERDQRVCCGGGGVF